MKIESLEYIDHASGWRLEKTDFDRLTLLVGASGVGKSRILQVVLHLSQIADPHPFLLHWPKGVEWSIRFSISSGRVCEWAGRFETKKKDKDSFNIEFERLTINDSPVVDRDLEGIRFHGKETVKLSRRESVLDLLKEEEEIREIKNEFSKILFDDSGLNEGLLNFIGYGWRSSIIFDPKKEATLDNIRNSNEGIKSKLYRTYANRLPIFNSVREVLVEIFPYIQDIRVVLHEMNIPDFMFDGFSKKGQEMIKGVDKYIIRIQIKEIGVTDWIGEERISSGMLKTLLHIAELYLCADHSLILIDEFENSLGVNCIDEMTSTMLAPERNLQFILTSHHPYIINNIGPEYWKVVTRKGSVVTTRDAAALGIGRSKHEAFIQLINREEYSEGVTA
uniref:Predicted ATPase n=1 Tax=Candidatus Kentrum sp. LFY TaxID=2126342 RepID=A0A450W7U6_9GAMM|nr:MAG: Predicted ATPase [Candidatus Kentron sp. LFY]